MTRHALRLSLTLFVLLLALISAAQAPEVISAENITRLRPALRIDFADLPDEHGVGFFAMKADASEFLIFAENGRISAVGQSGGRSSWTYLARPGEQVYSLIDAIYAGDAPLALYVLDGEFFVNEAALAIDETPVALGAAAAGDGFMVEALDEAGDTVYLVLALDEQARALRLLASAPFPQLDDDAPQVRIGRIALPWVIMSALEAGALTVFRYPAEFTVGEGKTYALDSGPAVFGAVNAIGSHFIWSDPWSMRLNLLDLDAGENRVVAELDGAYAQYHLLSADADVTIVVNLDFAPEVFAWDTETGVRYDLGAYRYCERIPDKVALSGDGKALVIGCDTGLEIWRIENEEES